MHNVYANTKVKGNVSDKDRKILVEYLASIHKDDLELMLDWVFRYRDGYKDILAELSQGGMYD